MSNALTSLLSSGAWADAFSRLRSLPSHTAASEILFPGPHGSTALHVLAQRCMPNTGCAFWADMLGVLSETHPDLLPASLPDASGSGPLHLLCARGCNAELLLGMLAQPAQGAEALLARDGAGRTPLECARAGDACWDCGEARPRGAAPPSSGPPPDSLLRVLSQSAWRSATPLLQRLPREAAASQILFCSDGHCALHVIALRSRPNSSCALWKVCCDALAPDYPVDFPHSFPDAAGNGPLHLLCLRAANAELLVEMLMRGGAGALDARNHDGLTPLDCLREVTSLREDTGEHGFFGRVVARATMAIADERCDGSWEALGLLDANEELTRSRWYCPRCRAVNLLDACGCGEARGGGPAPAAAVARDISDESDELGLESPPSKRPRVEPRGSPPRSGGRRPPSPPRRSAASLLREQLERTNRLHALELDVVAVKAEIEALKGRVAEAERREEGERRGR
ncbi:hypothetical protein TeGR_g7610 [Tetraparma gracilis]|uniref:RanBP2-type domain-containing protein n=1 Tax=Tetraparma gracilis TaxID=2962635 RepID=A0ABQ6MLJ0_9STRA|nr:hypothetical protein TeGR_g7610 [Tetraparma gracilis]